MTPRKNECYLSDLELGSKAKIIGYSNFDVVSRRLIEIGFSPDKDVQYKHKAPFNDPKDFLVGGSEIAIRNEEAKKIIVRPYEK